MCDVKITQVKCKATASLLPNNLAYKSVATDNTRTLSRLNYASSVVSHYDQLISSLQILSAISVLAQWQAVGLCEPQ